MKKTLFTLFAILGLTAFAQQEAPPQGINYQAVVYSDNGNSQPGINSPGQVLWNHDITMRFSIYQGSDNPVMVYQEMHAITTDEFGMVSLIIGEGVPQGTQLFETINWGGGSHFLRVDVDKNAGINFESMSYQKLWSVPYALYSEQSNSSNYSDSSDYSSVAGNGITGVTDNGDGTLTFTYFDGSSYTTPVLSGLGGVGPQGPAGTDGLSAYEVWLSQGNTGTEADFLNGITGPQGPAGADGQSAYEVWLSQGNTGTETDFLNGITGPQGPAGTNGVDGTDGQDGLSAYEVWLSQGNTGTEADFLNGITGPQGPAGTNGIDGADGLSAYEVWLSQGNTGTEADFLNGITGPQGPTGANGIDGATGPAGADGQDGQDGLSAYEVWLSQGNTGTEADFLNGITGPQGPQGQSGANGYNSLISTSLEPPGLNCTNGGIKIEVGLDLDENGILSLDEIDSSQTKYVCEESIINYTASSLYPSSSYFCASGPTEVVEVINPTTGKIWMDRNIGAQRAANSINDQYSYGDLYQWGRRSDGHQCRTSFTVKTTSASYIVNHQSFITSGGSNWLSPTNNNLWQGVNGINNPCPNGFKVPTSSEWTAEMNSWSSNDHTGAFESVLKFSSAGYRTVNPNQPSAANAHSIIFNTGVAGYYWSSTLDSQFPESYAFGISFSSTTSNIDNAYRMVARSIRCIKN